MGQQREQKVKRFPPSFCIFASVFAQLAHASCSGPGDWSIRERPSRQPRPFIVPNSDFSECIKASEWNRMEERLSRLWLGSFRRRFIRWRRSFRAIRDHELSIHPADTLLFSLPFHSLKKKYVRLAVFRLSLLRPLLSAPPSRTLGKQSSKRRRGAEREEETKETHFTLHKINWKNRRSLLPTHEFAAESLFFSRRAE